MYVFYRRIFNLEMQSFSLQNHHFMNARQPFCWWMTFTEVSIRFFPHPLNGRHDHWTFVGEGSMGDFEVVFFSQTSGVWNFFPPYNGLRFFSGLYVMSNIFFSACFCFSQEFLCMLFSSRNQSAGYFFWNHPWTPQKWNSWPLKSTKHLLSWQILICNHF